MEVLTEEPLTEKEEMQAGIPVRRKVKSPPAAAQLRQRARARDSWIEPSGPIPRGGTRSEEPHSADKQILPAYRSAQSEGGPSRDAGIVPR